MHHLSRMLTLTAVVAAGTLVPIASAQFDPDWITRYASPDGRKDEASAVVTDAAGNVYVTGSSGFTNLNTWNIVTVSYAPDGTERWIDVYDNPGGTQDLGTAMTMAPDGTLIVVGRSAGNMLVIKYDPADGSRVWVRTHDAGGTEHPNAVITDDTGHLYLTGQSYASNQNDYYTIKMDPDGDVLWTARYNGPGAFLFAHDVAYDIGLDSTGDVYVTGSSNAPGSATGDYVTIRYHGATGAQMWLDRYSGGSNEVAYELAIDAADHLYVTGGSFQNGHKFVTIRYDVATGTRDWVAIDAPAVRNIATQIALDAQGDVIVSGLADPDGDESNFNENIATIKHRASDGAVLWSQSYGSNAVGTFDVPHDLVIDSADHVFVTGENTGVIILLEYEGATGALLQLDTVPGGPNEIAAGIAITLDPDERPVVAALARNYNTENRDYLTLAYPAQTVASRVGDLDGDDVVGPADLALLLASWGRCAGCPEDLDGDGDVDAADLAMLLGDWG